MDSANSFQDVLQRLQAGDEDAATAIFERFASRLVSLARARLDNQLRQKVDPEDIAQSVFKSFFRRQGDSPFSLDDWNGLWGLLVTITVRKCGRRAEEFHAARRDIRREQAPRATEDDSQPGWQLAAPNPTPAETAMLVETVEQLMRGLDEREQAVLTRRLQGYTIAEISEQIGRTERTVHRVLDKLRNRLHRIEEELGSEV